MRLILLLTLLLAALPAYALDAYPGCDGHGCDATCGAGATRGNAQTIYYVNDLSCAPTGSCQADNPATSCSLVDCINGTEAGRNCIFNTSGVIDCTSEGKGTVKIQKPYITIAGQTAPEPGIIWRNQALGIEASNVCIYHMWFEGGEFTNLDLLNVVSFNGNSVDNVIINQNTLRWSTDGAIDIVNFATNGTDTVSDISVTNNLIYQGIDDFANDKTSFAMLISGRKNTVSAVGERISLIGNVFAHFDERIPKIAGAFNMEMINNYSFNGNRQFVAPNNSSYEEDGPSDLDIYGNYSEAGLDSNSGLYTIKNPGGIDGNTEIFVGTANQDGNIDPQRTSDADDVWDAVQTLSNSYQASSALVSSGYTATTAALAKTNTLSNSGAWPDERDSEDTAFIADINGSQVYRIPSCVTGCGDQAVSSLPVRAVNAAERQEVVPAPADRDTVQGSGYTALEEWLHEFKTLREGTTSGEPAPPDPLTLRGGVKNTRITGWRFGR